MPNEELKEHNLEHVLQVTYNLFLENGIEKVTKEMISKESGLSRRTIDRYFGSKLDCVVQVIQWMLQDVRMNIGNRYPEEMFTSGQYTGVELLQMYLTDIKEFFFEDPRSFVLYTEFKIFVYRSCENFEQQYSLLWNWMGNRRLRLKIYDLGKQDGSLSPKINLHTEEEYFCESFFGFLSNLALSFRLHSRDDIELQIDQRIKNTVFLYSNKHIPGHTYSQPMRES